jgi:ABC-type dipeptide/oligopeptide/nickel transport system ATPase component
MGVESFKILLDSPAEQPALGFSGYTAALREIIENSRPQFAIGIFGGWGSGKTTLMHALEKSLDKKKIIAVRFSAWRYEKEEHLIVPLLDVIRERLVQWADENAGMKKIALETASTVGKVMHSLLAGLSIKVGMPRALEMSFEANKALEQGKAWREEDKDARTPRSFYHASFQALREAFQSFVGQGQDERRIVIFVDDLDRCLPQGALEVLESMKLFFDLEGFIFVVGLDQAVVEWSIDTKYRQQGSSDEERETRRIRGSDYIKKIFQVPFSLAPIANTQLDEFLSSIYQEAALPPEQQTEMETVVSPHLGFLFTEAGINPREVKRYINAYTLLRKIKPWLDPGAALAIQTISFRPDWEGARKGLLLYRSVFTDALSRQLNGEPDALKDLDPRLAGIPDSFFRYMEPGGPGNSLLTVSDVDVYIYAGESTRSSRSHYWLELIRRAAELRKLFRDSATTFSRGQVLSNDLQPRMYSLISELDGGDSGARVSPMTVKSLKDLVEESNSLAVESPERKEEVQSWLQRSERAISQVISNLMAFYEAGDVGARESAR